MTSIKDLSLNNNQLAGAIPSAWGPLGAGSLSALFLANNTALAGCLPGGLAKFSGSKDVCQNTKLTCKAC